MKKILHIAKSGLLKHKSASISLFIIIMLVSILISIGFSILLGTDKEYWGSVERLNSLHSALVLQKEIYNPLFDDEIKNDSRVSQYEIAETLYLYDEIDYGGKTELTLLIFNIDEPLKISIPKITHQDLSVSKTNSVYLPAIAEHLGFNIGDKFTFSFKNNPYELTVAGFFASSEFTTVRDNVIKVFVSDECFTTLGQQLNSAVWIAARFFDHDDSSQFNSDFASRINIPLSDFINQTDVNIIYNNFISGVAIIFTIIIIFALIIAAIALFVIRLRVTSSIEDSMREIGVLKSSGYTNSQIISCYIMEYSLISIPATIIGVFVSAPIFLLIRPALTSMTSFMLTISTNYMVGFIGALVLIFVLLLMVRGSCRKISKMTPVAAIRGGNAANSFRRNYFPLNKGVGSVQIRLGLKTMLSFMKSYNMVGIVIMAISISVVFGAALYEIFVINTFEFAGMAGTETYDISILTAQYTDADILAIDIMTMSEVRKTTMLDTTIKAKVDDISIYMLNISNDYKQLENKTARAGRFPKYDNEAALPKLFADRIGKGIGDVIIIDTNGVSQDYIITGLYSTLQYGGYEAAITLDGYQRIDPKYQRNNICVYLNEGVDIKGFVETLTQKYGVINSELRNGNSEDVTSSSDGYQIEKITLWSENVGTHLNTISDIAALLTQAIIAVSFIIIPLILFMTVRIVVSKRRRELGIMKAAGYTSKQLARQLAISFMPIAVIGVIFGCTVGVILVRPLIGAILSSSGDYGTPFSVSPLITVVVGISILLVSFIVANISAMRIKNISVYELISE